MKRIKRMKKIIACILSIAVLFAFAACEASTPVSYYGKNVDSITLLSAPDYVQGETLNPADLSFRVVYNNGETATRNGAELGLAPTTGIGKDLAISTSGSYVLAVTNTFGIAYGTTRPDTNGNYNVKAVWPVEITAVDPDALTYVVDPTNAAKEIKKGGSLTAEDVKGIVVTAKFANGNTKVVSATIAGIDENDFSVDTTGAAESTTTVKAVNTKITINPDWILTIKDTTDEITGFRLVFDDEQEIFKKGETLLKDVKYSLVVTRETSGAGTPIESDDFTSKKVDAYFVDFDPDHTNVQDITSAINVRITYENVTKIVPLPIDYTDDYPTTFTAVLTNDKATFKDGNELTADMFTYTFSSWASEYDYKTNKEAEPADYRNITVVNGKILEGEQKIGEEGSHTVYLYWADEAVRSKVNTGSAEDVTVTLAALQGSTT